MKLLDSHSHIYTKEFDDDRMEVVARAKEAGVVGIVLPNINCKTIPRLKKVVEQFPGYCYPAIGLHPTSIKGSVEEELSCIEKELAASKYYAIGEIGIDLYWDKTFLPEQLQAFRFQLQLAKKAKLPVIIHTRDSFSEVFSVVDEEISEDLTGVFHSFSGTENDYLHIKKYKTFLVGIGGVVTFKNSSLASVVKTMDLSDIILETDSPYLTPHPYRGKRNEPERLPLIAQKIADLKEVSVDEIANVTTRNAQNLFRL